MNHSEIVSFLWGVADLIRDTFKRGKYQDVILPLTVLRRLDCVLASTKEKVLARNAELKGKLENLDPQLRKASGFAFYNTSRYDFEKLLDDAPNLAANLRNYINGFSENMREVVEKFDFDNTLSKLDDSGLLFRVLERFKNVDLHPDKIDNPTMGTIFEELIRKFNEALDENPGEHFTPRDVVHLMVDLLLAGDEEVIRGKGVIRTVCDPCCGSGGMLSITKDHILGTPKRPGINPSADIHLFGQEVNPETYAICKSDMFMKSKSGRDAENIRFGTTLANDSFQRTFDYQIANPPYGKDWKRDQQAVKAEHERGRAGRFGAGLPRISDGQLLFLQHMLYHMKPVDQGGARVAIIMNGSPLFTGDAGSGESEIRRWIFENDWLEALVALPQQLFYNTGIATYVWVLSNRKAKERQGKVQLIDARSFWAPLRKSLGNKRHEIPAGGDKSGSGIFRLLRDFKEGPHSKIYPTTHFGFRKITVERPLRLNFQAAPERLARLEDEPAFQKLAVSQRKNAGKKEEAAGRAEQDAIRKLLASLPETLYRDRAEFVKVLNDAVRKADYKLAAPIQKAILSALSERDEEAAVCTFVSGDKTRQPEPDSEATSTERVPLDESVDSYFGRKVRPFLSDAWIKDDGKKPVIGYSIDFSCFETERLERQARDAGLLEFPSRAIVSRVNHASPGGRGFEDFPDSIYVPTVGLGKVLASIGELISTHDRYFQIQLRSTAGVQASYLAEYLNSPPGRTFRETLMRGSYIPRASRDAWLRATFYLPKESLQREVMRLATNLRRVEAELSSLRDILWREPNRTTEIERRVLRLGRGDALLDWIETLPFPLSSVLWVGFDERRDLRKKVSYLDHFFEAVAEFTATVLLSGFRNDPELFEEEIEGINRVFARFGLTLERSSFGTWVRIVERLAKRLRTLLSGDDQSKSRIRTAFRVSTSEPLQGLASPAVVGVLQKANNWRNRHRGHGGAVNDAVLREQCALLEGYVSEYQASVGSSWEIWSLIHPGESRYKRGVHECSALRLVGPRTPFETVEVLLQEPAEYGELHLYDPGAELALSLLPFVSMMASPKTAQNACYFYNRLDGDGARYISYHFSQESEIVSNDASILEAVSLLAVGGDE